MHPANRIFWKKFDDVFGDLYRGKHVLEYGSYNVNGSVRDSISKPASHVGIDWRPGPCVDIVSKASEVDMGGKKYEAVLSCGMLEHDLEWKQSIDNMFSHLSPNGVMGLSWGSALNLPHCFETALDGKHHPRPAKQIFDHLESLGLVVVWFFYEVRHYTKGVKPRKSGGRGESNLVALHPELAGNYEKDIEDFFPEDEDMTEDYVLFGSNR